MSQSPDLHRVVSSKSIPASLASRPTAGGKQAAYYAHILEDAKIFPIKYNLIKKHAFLEKRFPPAITVRSRSGTTLAVEKLSELATHRDRQQWGEFDLHAVLSAILRVAIFHCSAATAG